MSLPPQSADDGGTVCVVCVCRQLRELLKDDARTEAMVVEADGVYLDFSRQNATPDTIKVRPGTQGIRCPAAPPLKSPPAANHSLPTPPI